MARKVEGRVGLMYFVFLCFIGARNSHEQNRCTHWFPTKVSSPQVTTISWHTDNLPYGDTNVTCIALNLMAAILPAVTSPLEGSRSLTPCDGIPYIVCRLTIEVSHDHPILGCIRSRVVCGDSAIQARSSSIFEGHIKFSSLILFLFQNA